MTASVRLAGVRWFQRIRNHLTQKAVKVLSRHDVQAEPRQNPSLQLAVAVQNDCRKADREGAVVLPSLADQIRMQRGRTVVDEVGQLIAHSDPLCAGGVHNHPSLAALNARAAFDLRNRGLPGGDA